VNKHPAATVSANPSLEQARVAVKRFGGVLVALVALFLYLSLTQEVFATADNIENLLRSSTVTYFVALGLTLVIISGGIDLSVGSVLALSGVALSSILVAGVPAPLAVVAVLLGAVALGALVNGVPVGLGRLSFFVVTLGSASLLRGAVFVVTDGETTYLSEYPLVAWIGNGEVWGLSVPILIALIVTIGSGTLLRYTSFGRSIFAIGGNPEAARLSGIRVGLVIVTTYGLCAGFAGLAGIVQAGRLDAASPTVGANVALVAAAAVLLGGTRFSGGVGGVTGTLVGTLFIGVLQNGLGLMGVSSYWQEVVTGAILIAAVAIDRLPTVYAIRRARQRSMRTSERDVPVHSSAASDLSNSSSICGPSLTAEQRR